MSFVRLDYIKMRASTQHEQFISVVLILLFMYAFVEVELFGVVLVLTSQSISICIPSHPIRSNQFKTPMVPVMTQIQEKRGT